MIPKTNRRLQLGDAVVFNRKVKGEVKKTNGQIAEFSQPLGRFAIVKYMGRKYAKVKVGNLQREKQI